LVQKLWVFISQMIISVKVLSCQALSTFLFYSMLTPDGRKPKYTFSWTWIYRNLRMITPSLSSKFVAPGLFKNYIYQPHWNWIIYIYIYINPTQTNWRSDPTMKWGVGPWSASKLPHTPTFVNPTTLSTRQFIEPDFYGSSKIHSWFFSFFGFFF